MVTGRPLHRSLLPNLVLLTILCIAWANSELEEFYVADLRQYTGSLAQPRILIGVCGEVFDVTALGSAHYGPGGSYASFAGRDATRALALSSFAEEDLARGWDLDGVPPEDVQPWCTLFREKYTLVGRLKASVMPSARSEEASDEEL